MNDSETNSSTPLNGEHPHLQRENGEPVSSSSTFSGIPGLGRLGNAPMSESPKPLSKSEITESYLEQPESEKNYHKAPMANLKKIQQWPTQSICCKNPRLQQHSPKQKLKYCSSQRFLKTQPQTSAIDAQEPETHASPPELTHALEAMLGGLLQPASVTANAATVDSVPAESAEEAEHPEWEVDSSPYESSSDSSDSSSDDDSEDEDGDNTYKLLSPEEQARILMEGDGGSDDEGTSKGAKGAGAQLRTKNEVPEEIIPKPDVTITPEMPIEELGKVQGIVDNIVLIKAFTTGEYRVLREESVLCLEDRSVVGVVSETLGRVEQPLYCVRFTNAEAIAEAGLHYKGTDASNLYDEEVGDEEMEFSDDEKEAEHKRKIKQKKQKEEVARLNRMVVIHMVGTRRNNHMILVAIVPFLNYDEAEDGPYKTLSRPTGFTGGAGGGEAPQEGSHYNRPSHRGDNGVRGRGRGRGDRGRGDRGRAEDAVVEIMIEITVILVVLHPI
ncbi:hypothetical protein DID88_000174 [Monilinia fructigena]|uniref:H/ACA ribonucleoprotein complex non-core subunit NAF1 n=1 Tax=Monilinia fructigena TaxID=38457 RepID=A0A395IPX6_9HELO|nr:hypothetical protein DID88_000174 [Monilinia fructigena]